MDCAKVGKLILELRREKNMTQKELADTMNLSDRTISRWERGVGCPDISLLNELSRVLGVNIGKILAGDLSPRDKDKGNMKKVKFYVCPTCGNILFSMSGADISCCGRMLEALQSKAMDDDHLIDLEEIEFDYFLTMKHEMTKAHFISFVAFVGYDRVMVIKLYPEWNAEVRFPQMRGGIIYAYCSEHGLWEKKI